MGRIGTELADLGGPDFARPGQRPGEATGGASWYFADAAGSTLAKLLPMLIDHATPGGAVPQESNLMEVGLNLLKSLQGQNQA